MWERPLVMQKEDFENCHTYEQILYCLEEHERSRKLEAFEFYGGRRSGRKKFFFMLQTFYPCFFVVFFIVFMIIFLN